MLCLRGCHSSQVHSRCSKRLRWHIAVRGRLLYNGSRTFKTYWMTERSYLTWDSSNGCTISFILGH